MHEKKLNLIKEWDRKITVGKENKLFLATD